MCFEILQDFTGYRDYMGLSVIVRLCKWSLLGLISYLVGSVTTLTFEVMGFRGTYHAIIGRPGYAKFMAIPNYTYLKLKMPGPKGVITVSSSFEHAYECDVECIEYGEAVERPWPQRLLSPSATRPASNRRKEPRRSHSTPTTLTARR